VQSEIDPKYNPESRLRKQAVQNTIYGDGIYVQARNVTEKDQSKRRETSPSEGDEGNGGNQRAKMIEGYATHGECRAIKDRRRRSVAEEIRVEEKRKSIC